MCLSKSRGLPLLLLALVSAAHIFPKDPLKLNLEGKTIPFLRSGVAWISAADGSFHTQGTVSKGRFRFKNLTPGSYVITMFHPRWGVTERTYQVLKRFADKRRLRIDFLMVDSDTERTRAFESRNMVSFRDLSISRKARKEYQKALDGLAKGREQDAIAHLQSAVEISPQFAEAWDNLGTAFFNAGHYAKAEEYYRQALFYNGELFHASVNLAASLIELRRAQEALNHSIYSHVLRPDNPLANAQLGINYFELEQDEDAVRYLTRAKKLDPTHFTLPQMYLAKIHLRGGRPRSALRELEEVLRRHPRLAEATELRQKAEVLKKAIAESK